MKTEAKQRKAKDKKLLGADQWTPNQIKVMEKRRLEYAQGLQNDPAKTIWVDMGVGAKPIEQKVNGRFAYDNNKKTWERVMKTETKQELKDRIAYVDRVNYDLREELHQAFARIDELNAYKKDWIEAVFQKKQWQVEADIARMEAKRSTIAAYTLAAYALALTIWVVV